METIQILAQNSIQKVTMSDDKVKIKFVPGCFDHFEGTQEELDALIKEVTAMFEDKSVDEIKEMGVIADPDDLPPEILAHLAEEFFNEDELEDLVKMGMPRRNLQ